MNSHQSARFWAYTGTVLGAGTSIAANIADAYVPPAAATTWTPEIGAVIGAVFWPAALLVASEVLARKRWARPSARVAGIGAVLLVGTVAGVISYQHLHDLLLHYQETPLAAILGPLAVDGLMIVSSLALVSDDAPILATAIDPPTVVAHLDPILTTELPDAPIRSPRAVRKSVGKPTPIPGSDRRSDRVVAARDEDMDRAREAIACGLLTPRPTAEVIRRTLKISPVYARAVRDALNQVPTLSDTTSDQPFSTDLPPDEQPSLPRILQPSTSA